MCMANSKSRLKTSLPLPSVTLLLHVAFGQFCNSPSTGNGLCKRQDTNTSANKSANFQVAALLHKVALVAPRVLCLSPRIAERAPERDWAAASLNFPSSQGARQVGSSASAKQET